MAALGWLLNLGFAGGGTPVVIPPPVRGGGGGGGPRYMHWSPSRTQTYKKKEIKKLLLEVAETDSKVAKKELEDKARHARDAVQMIQDVQQIIRELSGHIDSNARQLEITHQWAQKMIRRIEDERIILLLLLESD